VIAADVQFMSPRADDEQRRQPVAAGQWAAGRGPTPPSDEGDLEDLPF